jgi:hypothetical protein
VLTPMPYVMVDVEADGPIPGDYSMICFGAVIVAPELKRSFYGRLKPISEALLQMKEMGLRINLD